MPACAPGHQPVRWNANVCARTPDCAPTLIRPRLERPRPCGSPPRGQRVAGRIYRRDPEHAERKSRSEKESRQLPADPILLPRADSDLPPSGWLGLSEAKTRSSSPEAGYRRSVGDCVRLFLRPTAFFLNPAPASFLRGPPRLSAVNLRFLPEPCTFSPSSVRQSVTPALVL